MQHLVFHLPDTLGAALGWMLLHLLWQATAIGILTGIVLLLLRDRPARLRYWTANLALAAILCAASGTFLYYYTTTAPVPGVEANAATIRVAPAPQPVHAPDLQVAEAGAPNQAGVEDYFGQHLPAIVAFWFLGMSLFLLRLLGNIGYTYYLKTHLNFPADPYWQDLMAQLAQNAGITKTIGLVESALARTPMVVGHLKPVILFPIGMINRLDPAEAEAILAHELAHILRHDYLFNIFQSIVETLFYFHPAVWWLSGVVRHEREIAADDAAIRCTGNALAYAKALVLVQEMAFAPPVLAPAFAGLRKNRLMLRIQHILNIQQSKNLAMEKFIGVCAILLIILGIGFTQTRTTPQIAGPPDTTLAQAAPAGEGLSGAWQGTIENDQLCMSLVSRSKNSSWMNGTCFKLTEFSPMPASDVDFNIKRPAGTISFQGKFEGKEGYGRFSFEPDQSFLSWLDQQGIRELDDNMMSHLFFANVSKEYVESLKKAGYNELNGEDLSRLAIHEVTREDIANLKSMAKELGQDELSIDDLLNLKIHGVDREFVSSLKKAGFIELNLEAVQNAKIHELTPDFIQQCRNLGFSNLGLEEIMDLKIHEITPEYVRQCQNMGFSNLNADEVMNFKIHEITPEYIRQCRDMGFSNLNVDEVMNFKIHEISPKYLADLKSAGLSGLSADDVLNLKIQDVTPASIAELKKMGFGELSVDEIVNLHIHEVTPAFLDEMQKIGFKNLSADDAMNLKIHGIDGGFIGELNKAGFKNLSVDEAINCRIHEVSAEEIQAFVKLGFKDISVDDAVNAKIHGVTPAFIKSMRDKGFKDMDLDEYIQLKVQYGEKMK